MTEDEEYLYNRVQLEILKVVHKGVDARMDYRHGPEFRTLTQSEQVSYLIITNGMLESANDMADVVLSGLGVKIDGHDLDEKLAEVIQLFDRR